MVETILSIVGIIFSYFAGRKHQEKITENQILKNLETSVLLYQTILNDMSKEVSKLKEKINELEGKIDELIKENTELKKERYV